MTQSFQMSIDGALALSKQQITVINPATLESIALAPDCTDEQLDFAVAAANRAFSSWKNTSIDERKAMLNNAAEIILEHSKELIALLTLEQGKPLSAAEFDVTGGASWLSGITEIEIPEHIIQDDDDQLIKVHYEPVGVVAAIVPWNFPIILAMFKLAPALLAGNTVVLKPSPTTPLTTLKIGELIQSAFPPGVVNVISGGDQLGPLLTSHPGIAKISFTGSTATGKKVMESASNGLKKLTLELGGNDAAIVLPSVDIDKAAEDVLWAAIHNSGQLCVAAKRIYVHKAIYDRFKNAMVEKAKNISMGNGMDTDILLGPIQNKVQYNRLQSLLDESEANGHTIAFKGEGYPKTGYFIPLTIIDNPPANSRIVNEEQFGPIVPLQSYDRLEDVIATANASDFGLGATVWGSDVEEIQYAIDNLEVGTVWVNQSMVFTPHSAFGGRKQSGLGVENGVEGVLEFCVSKTTYINKQAL